MRKYIAPTNTYNIRRFVFQNGKFVQCPAGSGGGSPSKLGRESSMPFDADIESEDLTDLDLGEEEYECNMHIDDFERQDDLDATFVEDDEFSETIVPESFITFLSNDEDNQGSLADYAPGYSGGNSATGPEDSAARADFCHMTDFMKFYDEKVIQIQQATGALRTELYEGLNFCDVIYRCDVLDMKMQNLKRKYTNRKRK